MVGEHNHAPREEGKRKEEKRKLSERKGMLAKLLFSKAVPTTYGARLSSGGAPRKLSLHWKVQTVRFISAESHGFFSVGKTRASNHSLCVRLCGDAPPLWWA